MFIDILRSLNFDTLQGLWGFVKFYDSIDPAVLKEELSIQGYGFTRIALTMLVHFAPMLFKLGKVYKGPVIPDAVELWQGVEGRAVLLVVLLYAPSAVYGPSAPSLWMSLIPSSLKVTLASRPRSSLTMLL